MSNPPSPDDPEHKHLEDLLISECEKYNIRTLDLPQYYDLDKEQKDLYHRCFSNECLFIRSHPDKLLVGADTALIDCKTTQSNHKANIAIELSSFYWGLKYNVSGLHFYYLHYDSKGKPMVFLPINNKPQTFMLQPYWDGNPRGDIFKKYISEIKNIFENDKIPIRVKVTGGSKDPFILIGLESLKELPLKILLNELKLTEPLR